MLHLGQVAKPLIIQIPEVTVRKLVTVAECLATKHSETQTVRDVS